MVSEKICENCQSRIDELFVEVVNNKGSILDIVRHNALDELNHRWSGMYIQRRIGRSNTSKEITKYDALLVVLSNLENKDYVKLFLVMWNIFQKIYKMLQMNNFRKLGD